LRKFYLFIIYILSAVFASAQSFTSQDGLFEVSGPYDGPNIHGQVTVKNVSGQALDLICRISSANMTTGHTKWFCFGPNCYAPNVTVSLNTPLDSGDSAELLAYCAPNDSEGVSIINYEIFDVNGNSDTISFTFTYYFTFAGIDELSSANYFLNTYPNPASSTTTVNCYIASAKDARIVFQNIVGEQVKEICLRDNQNTLLLPVADFPDGIYMYTLLIDGIPTASRKLVVAH
jgi:hypothetical protein